MKKLPQIKTPVKILISGLLLAFLWTRMDKGALQDATHMVHASSWFYAVFFIIAQLVLLSLRWMYLINVGHFRMNFKDSVQVSLASQIANMLFLTTVSGIAVRVAMAYQHGASLFKSVFATAIDRIMTLAALLLLCAFFLPSLTNYIDASLSKNIGLFVAAMILVLFVLTPLLAITVANKIPARIFSKGNMRSGQRYIKLLFGNYGLLGKILSVSLLGQMSFFAAVYCIALSSGIELGFLQIMIVLPAIALVSSMPFSFGGWGIREGAFIYGLGLLNVPMETAFSVSVQIGLVSLIAMMLAGIPALVSSDMMTSKKRMMKAFAKINNK